MGYLHQKDLENIKNYKYHPGIYTPIDRLLTPFWEFVVTLLPKSLAPNMITLIGLLFSISSFLIYAFYSPNLSTRCPFWVYMYGAIGCFLYQTLDAVDGKQARRTNSSSPLGQLFDHGCDAFNTGFQGLGMCVALEVGSTPWTVILFACSTATFYLCQLMEFNTGVLITSDGMFGVTELEFIVILIHLVSGFFGSWVFHYAPVTIYGIPINIITLQCVGLIIITLSYYFQCFTVLFINKSPLIGDEIGNKKLDRSHNFLRTIPFLSYTAFTIYLTVFPSATVFLSHPFLVLLTLAFCSSIISIKLIIRHMAKSDIFPLQPAIVPLFFLALNQFYPIVNMTVLYVIALLVEIGIFFSDIIISINQICECLGIYCLSLGTKVE